MTREEAMSLALALAREAAGEGEVPVGCVIADADGAVQKIIVSDWIKNVDKKDKLNDISGLKDILNVLF